MAKKLAFSYIRMSTEAQLKGHSLERQMELAREYADDNNLELIESLQDIGLSAHSGANISKGELGRFLQALEDGEIEKDCVLLVENLDRLSRQSPRKAFNKFNEILDYGIEIHTVSDQQIYTAESVDANPGQLFASIGYMLRAFSESDEKSKRLKKKWGKKRTELDSKILTTIAPAWLEPKTDKSGFKIIPERARTIRKIFDLCIDDDMGIYGIARYLNEHSDEYPRFTAPKKANRLENGKTRTGWQKSYILKILHNTAVHGEFQPQQMVEGKREAVGEAIPDYFPVVVPRDRYLLARATMQERSKKKGGRKGDTFNNVFTKMLVCGNCHGAIHFRDKGRPPKGGKYLRCYNSESNHNCNCPAWNYADFEQDFFDFITEVPLEKILAKGNDKSRKTNLLEEQQQVSEKIKHKNTQFGNLSLMTEDISSESARKRISEQMEHVSTELDDLENRKQEIETELADIESRASVQLQADLVASIKKQEEKATDEKKAEIRRRINRQIGLVVRKITLRNCTDKVTPWEIVDRLSLLAKRELTAKGITDEIEIEQMFNNEYGYRLFNEMERTFTVHFKNGESKVVHPYSSKSWKRTKSRIQTFVENKKKREAEQSLKARRKAEEENKGSSRETLKPNLTP